MQGNSISLMINSVCRDLRIDYKSENLSVDMLYDDATQSEFFAISNSDGEEIIPKSLEKSIVK